MDVNPAISLAAVFIGGAIWGPLGALIGIPVAAAGVAVLDTYKRRYDLSPEILAESGPRLVRFVRRSDSGSSELCDTPGPGPSRQSSCSVCLVDKLLSETRRRARRRPL
jgi:hypothetical protein